MGIGNDKFYKDPKKATVVLLIVIGFIMFCFLIINLFSDKDSQDYSNPALKFKVPGEVISNETMQSQIINNFAYMDEIRN